MARKSETTDQELEFFYSLIGDNLDAVLETVLTDYDPSDKVLAIYLEGRESFAIKRLKSKDLKYDTDPKNLVQWHIKNSRNEDEFDIGSYWIDQWVHCRQVRHYLKENDPEMAVLAAVNLERNEAKFFKWNADVGWKGRQFLKKARTIQAGIVRQIKKRGKIELLLKILKSKGHTPLSINRKRNEKMSVLSLLNKELKKQGEKEISKATYHLYLKELRESSPSDAPENN